jgi:GNAT superfamily N-acetyltransferase
VVPAEKKSRWDRHPRLAWTEQEQAEPAVFLQSTVTHPDLAGQGIGVIIAFWALDHAARHGRRWVRRGVLTLGPANRGLVRYYRWQGWRAVRARLAGGRHLRPPRWKLAPRR